MNDDVVLVSISLSLPPPRKVIVWSVAEIDGEMVPQKDCPHYGQHTRVLSSKVGGYSDGLVSIFDIKIDSE